MIRVEPLGKSISKYLSDFVHKMERFLRQSALPTWQSQLPLLHHTAYFIYHRRQPYPVYHWISRHYYKPQAHESIAYRTAYGRTLDIVEVCCIAHCRRKFFETFPKERQKFLNLLDIHSEQTMDKPAEGATDDISLLPTVKGVTFCNRLFLKNVCLKTLRLKSVSRNVFRRGACLD